MEIVILIGIVVFLLWLFLGNSSSDKAKSEGTKPTYSPRPATTAWPTPVPVVSEQERQRQEAKALEEQKAKQAEIDRRERQRLAEIQEKQRQAAIQKQQQQVEKARQEEQRKLAILKQAQEEESKRVEEERRQKAFCEDGTSYCTSIKSVFERNPSGFQFSSIRSLSSNCGVFNELRSGVAQLQTHEQLSQYIFSYGLMHQAKLEQAFEVVINDKNLQLTGQNIELVDYGCGQGLGTICFLDYIKSRANGKCVITKVKLIEPSELALKRASLNVRYALRSANQMENVYAVNKELDDVLKSDLNTEDNSIKVHIFSNIIDVEDFELLALSQKIMATQTGVNYFVCVSPNIMQSRNRRLDRFQECFADAGVLTQISNRQSDIANPRDVNKPWRRYERIFKIHIGHSPNDAHILINSKSSASFNEENDLPF
jgi:hypothetical protein